MNDLSNRRFTEQLNKEKEQRRAWATHGRQQEIFDVNSSEYAQIDGLKDSLNTICAEPSSTGVTDPNKPVKSKRRQLKELRDELRDTLSHVDKKIADNEGRAVDEKYEDAKAAAKLRSERPPHLRGSAVLKESIGSAAP